MPKGYIIGLGTVHAPDAYKPYQLANNEIFPKYGGRFLVRGGDAQIVEGDTHARQVIVEFPSYSAALECYNSQEYQENLKIRQANAETTIIIVEGVEP